MNSLINDDPINFETTSNKFEELYCVISFVSPEKAIQQKLLNDISKFINYELNLKLSEISKASIDEFNIFVNNKHKEYINSLNDTESSINKESLNIILKELILNKNVLSEKYLKKHIIKNEIIVDLLQKLNFTHIEKQCDVNVVKVSGVFSNHEEADTYIEQNIKVPHVHTWVVAVGHWASWDPKSDIFKSTYKSDQIIVDDLTSEKTDVNGLMSSYKLNSEQSADFMDKINSEKTHLTSEDIVDTINKRSVNHQNSILESKIENIKKLRQLNKDKKNKRFGL